MEIHLSKLLITTLLLLNLWPGTSRAEFEQAYHHYRVEFEPAGPALKVHACFAGGPPGAMIAGDANAADYLTNVETERGGDSIKIGYRKIHLSGVDRRSCIRYSVALRKAARASRSHRYQSRIITGMVTQSGTWLWLPENNPFPVKIDFSLPERARVSAPWHRVDRSEGGATYRINRDSYEGSGYVVFGGFSERIVRVPGAGLRVAVMEANPPADADKLTAWVRRGAEAMIGLYGRFPLEQVQVLVFPIGRYSGNPDASPVPWGEVKRGGGSAVHLYVDHTRPLSELVSDWTLYHEMSHLIHPYIDIEGRWLSEGIATCYQNVLQARAGVLSERRAWQKLHEGFERGIKQTRRGRVLNDVSRNMHRNHQYMRVYWSGAAIAILADVYLRKMNRGSLDQALYRFRDCCLPARRTWTAPEFMAQLDTLMDSKIFMDLYESYAHSDRFPALDEIYDSLGLSPDRGRVVLDKRAVRSDIRRAIMQAPST